MLSLEKGNQSALRLGLSQVLQSGVESEAKYIYHEGVLYWCNAHREVEICSKNLPLVDWYELVTIAVNPQDQNQLWISLGEKGLFRSPDRGRTLERCESVAVAEQISVSTLHDEGTDECGLLLTGRLHGGQQGTFYSSNGGKEWGEVR